jgi:hypothetical protein
VLFVKFGVDDLAQNEKRLRLAERALDSAPCSSRSCASGGVARGAWLAGRRRSLLRAPARSRRRARRAVDAVAIGAQAERQHPSRGGRRRPARRASRPPPRARRPLDGPAERGDGARAGRGRWRR